MDKYPMDSEKMQQLLERLQIAEEKQQEAQKKQQEAEEKQQELLERLQIAQEEQQEAKKKQQEAEEKQQEAEKKQQEAEEKSRNLEDGLFFLQLNDLWGAGIKGTFGTTDAGFNKLQEGRNILPEKLESTVWYETTQKSLTNLETTAYRPKTVGDGGSKVTSSNNSTAAKLWGNENVFGGLNGDMAHLVPHSPKNAKSWWFLSRWMFGSNMCQWTWEQHMKVIQGSSTTEAVSKKEKYTGIKHMVTNKLRILGQNKYFDIYPCLLIIPALTVEEVLNWDGRGYDAIAVIKEYEATSVLGRPPKNGKTIKEVADGTDMKKDANNTSNFIINASDERVEKARNLLTFFLRAIFTVTKNEVPEDAEEIIKNNTLQLYGASGEDIICPTKMSDASGNVRLVRFGNVEGPGYVPDPMLLVTKSAVVYSAMNQQRLAAGAEPKEDANWDELHQIAAEAFYEALQKSFKPSNDWDTLAASLGQPGATCPPDWNEIITA